MAKYPTAKGMWTFLISFPLLLAPIPADSFVIINHHTANALNYCDESKLYGAHNTDAPAIIAASFAGEGRRVAFRTCPDGDGNMHYFLREPRPNNNGVCRVFEREVFSGTEKDELFVQVLYDGTARNWYFTMKGWKVWPPDDWTSLHYSRQSAVLGFVTSQDCPPGDDPRYIWLKNVTDGMLKTFQNAWDAARRSPEALVNAFRDVPTEGSKFPGQMDAQPSQALRDRFRSAVIEGHDKLTGISCDDRGCYASLSNQAIGFDVTPSGIVFTKLIALWRA